MHVCRDRPIQTGSIKVSESHEYLYNSLGGKKGIGLVIRGDLETSERAAVMLSQSIYRQLHENRDGDVDGLSSLNCKYRRLKGPYFSSSQVTTPQTCLISVRHPESLKRTGLYVARSFRGLCFCASRFYGAELTSVH